MWHAWVSVLYVANKFIMSFCIISLVQGLNWGWFVCKSWNCLHFELASLFSLTINYRAGYARAETFLKFFSFVRNSKAKFRLIFLRRSAAVRLESLSFSTFFTFNYWFFFLCVLSVQDTGSHHLKVKSYRLIWVISRTKEERKKWKTDEKTFSCCCWFSQWGRKMGKKEKFAQLGLVKGSFKLWEIYPSSNETKGKTCQVAEMIQIPRWTLLSLEIGNLKTFQHFPRGFAREDEKQLNRAAATQGRDSNFLRWLRRNGVVRGRLRKWDEHEQ